MAFHVLCAYRRWADQGWLVDRLALLRQSTVVSVRDLLPDFVHGNMYKGGLYNSPESIDPFVTGFDEQAFDGAGLVPRTSRRYRGMGHRWLRRVLSVVVAVGVVATVLGAGGQAASASGAERLVVITPEPPNAPRGPWFETLARTFMQEQPGVEVELIFSTTGARLDYPERIEVLIAADQVPDVAFLHERDVLFGGWIDGMLLDLGARIRMDAVLSRDPLFAASAAGWTYRGRLVGLPVGLGPQTFFYDADKFEQAGIPVPADQYARGSRLFPNFRETARRLTLDVNGDGEPDQWGFLTDWTNEKAWSAFILSNGVGS